MDEQTIVEQLKQNIPDAPIEVGFTPPAVSTDEQSAMVLDTTTELALLKLGTELGLEHPDATTTGRLKYIYDQATALAATQSYESVAAVLNDFMLRLGIRHEPDRFMRLYLWIKLNSDELAARREANDG